MKSLDNIKQTPKRDGNSPSEGRSLSFGSANPGGGQVDAGTIDSPATCSL